MKVERFEDLVCWKKARTLTNLIYELSLGNTFSKDFALKQQIHRSAISVMSNIAEGFERGTNAEFIHFLYTAKGSAGEIQSQLYIAFDRHYIAQKSFDTAYTLCQEISKMIYALIEYLKKSAFKGAKFK